MIDKKVNKSGTVRVTFELPGDAARESASVVGTFNDWDPDEGEMTYVRSREVWKKQITLEAGQTYEFRYYLDGGRWENDDEADGTAPTQYFADNSVLAL